MSLEYGGVEILIWLRQRDVTNGFLAYDLASIGGSRRCVCKVNGQSWKQLRSCAEAINVDPEPHLGILLCTTGHAIGTITLAIGHFGALPNKDSL